MTDRPTSDVILTVLTNILRRLCELDRLELSPDMPLVDIPGIDSLRILQTVALAEEHFRMEIDVVALENLHRVRDVMNAIAPAPPEV